MRHMVFKILKSWYTMHIKNWPANIVYYRDCVSESQFDNVVTTELPKFKKAFQLLADDLQAKDENGIPTAWSPYYSDFCLQSHNGIKGTTRPRHYFVLRNEIEASTAALQQLAN
ncbi:hypothetical protein N0V91_002646 [Didymella pomorum]|uniref:Piwi domain-containing protein n=1 Tax=Didymella pomorum TaxID=749634 RepID=A0A9W8ZJS6_9PLEO|nr:hypothetical protein N0V91_002646 [Didymella pomorum]